VRRLRTWKRLRNQGSLRECFRRLQHRLRRLQRQCLHRACLHRAKPMSEPACSRLRYLPHPRLHLLPPPPLQPTNRASSRACSSPLRVSRRCKLRQRQALTIKQASSRNSFSRRCIPKNCVRHRRQRRPHRDRDRRGRANSHRYSATRKSQAALQRLHNLLPAALPPKPSQRHRPGRDRLSQPRRRKPPAPENTRA
jgi:hypothetical protein